MNQNELKGLALILREAFEVLDRLEIEVGDVPRCYRYPLKWEIYGYALRVMEEYIESTGCSRITLNELFEIEG